MQALRAKGETSCITFFYALFTNGGSILRNVIYNTGKPTLIYALVINSTRLKQNLFTYTILFSYVKLSD